MENIYLAYLIGGGGEEEKNLDEVRSKGSRKTFNLEGKNYHRVQHNVY